MAPRRWALVVAALASVGLGGAGCDAAVEMSLVPPAASDDIDTSCVTAVELTLTGVGLTEETYACVEVTPGTVASLRDHNLDGLFDVPLPPWKIVGVQVRGVAAPEGCINGIAVGPTIFVASSDTIDDAIELPLRGVLSCADRVDAATPVRVVDMGALVGDGTCAAAEGLQVQPGELFPTLLYGPLSGWLLYYWAPPATVPASGLVQLPYSFSAAASGSCVGLFVGDGAEQVAGCLTPAGRGACGPEPEFHYVPYTPTATASLSTEELLSRTTVVFGTVVDRARVPIVGATITTAAADAVIHYTTPQAGAFVAMATATATAASGTFSVLANKPVLVEVSAPGKATRRVMAGGNGATVVVMDPAPN